MKKYLWMIIGAISLMMAVSAPAFAATTANINVTISISASADITVTPAGPIDFGIKGINSSAISASAIVIKNTGSGSAETYSLSLTDPLVAWKSVTTTPGFDQYRLSAAFATTGTAITWVTSQALTTTPVAASATQFAGDQTGLSVAYNDSRNLWLKLETPNGTSSPAQKTIAVTITATPD